MVQHQPRKKNMKNDGRAGKKREFRTASNKGRRENPICESDDAERKKIINNASVEKVR